MRIMSNITTSEKFELHRSAKKIVGAFKTYLENDVLAELIQCAAEKAFVSSLTEGAPSSLALRFLAASKESGDGYNTYYLGSPERPYLILRITDSFSIMKRLTDSEGLLTPPGDITDVDQWAKDQFFGCLEERFEEVNIYGSFAALLFKELIDRYTFLQLAIDIEEDRILALFHDELDDLDLSFHCEIVATFAPIEETHSEGSTNSETRTIPT